MTDSPQHPASLPVPVAATLDFTPVPRARRRHDGWTPKCQRAFIAALAECGSVTGACRAVGKSFATAYRLYNHPEGASLRAAWDRALEMGGQRLRDIAMERIVEGVPSPVFYQGQVVGERRLYHTNLLVQMIKHGSGGYANSPVGHRSRAAMERHAAENCPTCRERREAEAAALAAQPSLEDQAKDAGLALLNRYALKIEAERSHRLAGKIVAADFALRQVTVLEILLEGCGMDMLLRAWWGEDLAAVLDAAPTDFLRELDAIKQRVWAKAGDPPRPDRRLEPGVGRDSSVWGGPTMLQRGAAQAGAAARIAAAQAEWEAAAREDTWAAWCARG